MSCDDTQILLDAFVDGELDLVRSLEIEKHLETCGTCARLVENRQALGAAFRDSSLYYRAPQGLERRVDEALRRTSSSRAKATAPPSRRQVGQAFSLPRRIPWSILAVAASLLLAAIFVDRLPFASRRVSQDLVVQEVLDSHLRSLMPGHLADVQSTDQHTVKPWFNGKLDFSPPVDNFAEQGFPLIGGRLDSIDGRVVAALIYQRRQHLINVYVWPSSGSPDTPISATTRQGYHVLHWTRSALSWWVVSDLNDVELASLANILRASPPPPR